MCCDDMRGSSDDELAVIITAEECTNTEQDMKVQRDKCLWYNVQVGIMETIR